MAEVWITPEGFFADNGASVDVHHDHDAQEGHGVYSFTGSQARRRLAMHGLDFDDGFDFQNLDQYIGEFDGIQIVKPEYRADLEFGLRALSFEVELKINNNTVIGVATFDPWALFDEEIKTYLDSGFAALVSRESNFAGREIGVMFTKDARFINESAFAGGGTYVVLSAPPDLLVAAGDSKQPARKPPSPALPSEQPPQGTPPGEIPPGPGDDTPPLAKADSNLSEYLIPGAIGLGVVMGLAALWQSNKKK